MIYPNNFEQKISFDKIRETISNKCISKAAREKVEQLKFTANYQELDRILSLTSEMKTICMMEEGFPDTGYVDVKHFIPKVRIEGNYLEINELYSLKKALDTTRSIVNFFKKKEDSNYPYLYKLTSSIVILPEISSQIDRVVDPNGNIRENASPDLRDLKQRVYTKQAQVSKRMQAILKSAQSEGIVDEGAAVGIHDGHAVIPINAVHKRKIKGFVMGESSTGKTLFIEPVEVIELNNEIRELEFAIQREIIRILKEVTAFLSPYADDLDTTADLLSEIDFIRAKAYYAIEIDGVKPILSRELQLNLRQAKHPLLMKALKKEKKEVVPLSLELNLEQHILLISGPNAGGKSVCLKTVGLLQYMLQCGILISVLENSEIGLFRNIFIDIGDEQSIENDLSTYSSHLTNMKHFLRYSNEHTLVLIDEFGTGTEPAAGGAIAEAVLGSLVDKKSFGLITTHYTNLKYFASAHEGILNGAMLFDTVNIQPLFKLETGIPGSSFAFEIARKIGLPESVLKVAESKMGEKQVGMERSLREIARDKKYWEDKRQRIKHADKNLEEITARYEKELTELKESKKAILKEAKEQAKQLLAGANKQIENTIRTIKESQAEKEKTREVRLKLDAFKETIQNETNDNQSEKINDKIKQIQDRRKRREERRKEAEEKGSPIVAVKKEAIEEAPLTEGDKVKVAGQTAVGEVIKIAENNIIVAFGQLILNVKPSKVQRISQQAYRNTAKESPTPSKPSSEMNTKRLNFKPTLDVRGCRTIDALDQVVAFIDEALMFGISEVSILHGKGNGILKQEIRTYLRTFGGLLKCSDAMEEAGGAGITIVRFS